MQAQYSRFNSSRPAGHRYNPFKVLWTSFIIDCGLWFYGFIRPFHPFNNCFIMLFSISLSVMKTESQPDEGVSEECRGREVNQDWELKEMVWNAHCRE